MLCSGCPGSGSSFNAKSKITFKVVDENNNPLKGILVGITFPRMFYGKEKNKTVNELTDINGGCSASGTSYGTVFYGVRKEGYYNSTNSYKYKQKDFGSWAPKNPEVIIVLRKIENPVPMYARQIQDLMIPVLNKGIGFDLIQSDWVKPYGRGEYSDLNFKIVSSYTNNLEFDGKLIVSTQGKADGLILVKENLMHGSAYKLPRFAPIGGYENVITKTSSRSIGKPLSTDVEEDNNYVFRIRSSQKDGIFHRALYGKIRGDFNFFFDAEKASVNFTYYLNPDYTRNLEFDPKHNLYSNLPDLQRVSHP